MSEEGKLYVYRKGKSTVETSIAHYKIGLRTHSYSSEGILIPYYLYINFPEKWKKYKKLVFEAYCKEYSDNNGTIISGDMENHLGVFKVVTSSPLAPGNGFTQNIKNVGTAKKIEFSVEEAIEELEKIKVYGDPYIESIGIICGASSRSDEGGIVIENIWFE